MKTWNNIVALVEFWPCYSKKLHKKETCLIQFSLALFNHAIIFNLKRFFKNL